MIAGFPLPLPLATALLLSAALVPRLRTRWPLWVSVLARILFVVLENRPRETRIVSDLFAGAIVVATLLGIVNFAFEVPIRGLLATSGVIAIVLGLALRSTLSDVFSGIAVGLERPYVPGGLLWSRAASRATSSRSTGARRGSRPATATSPWCRTASSPRRGW